MDYNFHYLLMANQSIFHRGVFSKLKDTGLTLGQPKVLDYLKDNDGASQKEIAIGCHVEPASLTVILNGMEDKGLIERKNINGNRRTIHVYMTQKGKNMQKEIDEAFSFMEDIAFKNISLEQKNNFLEVFEKIYTNLLDKKGDL